MRFRVDTSFAGSATQEVDADNIAEAIKKVVAQTNGSELLLQITKLSYNATCLTEEDEEPAMRTGFQRRPLPRLG